MRTRTKDRHLPACMYLKHGRYWLVKKGKWTDLGADLPSALAEYGRILQTPQSGMADLIDKVLADMQHRNLAKSTLEQYTIAAKKLKRILVEFTPEQVKGKHVAALKSDFVKTPNMGNRVLSFLRQVFTYAVEAQIVESNPVLGIEPFREKKRTRLITEAEYRAIYSHAGPRLQVIMDLLYLTGQRIDDVLKIKISDLPGDGLSFVQKKTKAKLAVRWTPELRAVVDRAKELHGKVRQVRFQDGDAYLLPAKQGKAPDYRTVRGQWEDACEAAKVEDAHLHDIRAMSLTATQRQGQNATALAGHSSEAMTKRYLRDRESPVVDGPSFRRSKDAAK